MIPAGQAYASPNLRLAEQKIKAGLLYNFIKHTEWPPVADEAQAPALPLVLCVYGRDSFEDYLRPMAGRTVNQRKLALQRIRMAAESDACHIVFVSTSEQENWPALRHRLGTRPILTVGDFDGFAREGGMIEFREVNKRVGAIFNLDAFANAALRIGESLMNLKGVEKLTTKGTVSDDAP